MRPRPEPPQRPGLDDLQLRGDVTTVAEHRPAEGLATGPQAAGVGRPGGWRWVVTTAGWGELERGDLAVGVTWHPLRKGVAVTVRRGTTVYTTAYCRNEEEADRLWAALVEITDARPEVAS